MVEDLEAEGCDLSVSSLQLGLLEASQLSLCDSGIT